MKNKISFTMTSTLFIILAILFFSCKDENPNSQMNNSETVFFNGKIYTVNAED